MAGPSPEVRSATLRNRTYVAEESPGHVLVRLIQHARLRSLTGGRPNGLSRASHNGPAMTRITRSLLSAALIVCATGALASGSSAPFNYAPDPALKTASKTDLESRIRHACTATQAKLQNADESRLQRPCGCYAG